MSAVEKILKDLVVLEVANVLAGPAVGQFFAELGATVVKVENPNTGGDTTRHWKLPTEDSEADISSYFSSVNWGKQSIGINFGQEEGRKVVYDLVARADIFLQSFKPGDEQKFKFDYKTLKAINERLIYAHITAYGLEDKRTGFDAIIQAESGFTAMNGASGSDGVKMPVALIDILLAHQLKQAILLALIERLQTGIGSYVTISLIQAGITALANQATNYLVGNIIPTPVGSDHPNIVPYGTMFKTRDGHDVVLGVGTDQQFQALCDVIGIPECATDDRFLTNHHRLLHKHALIQIIKKRIHHMTRDTLLQALNDRRVPAGAVHKMDDVFRQPQAKALLLEGRSDNQTMIQGLRSIAFESDKVDTKQSLTPPPHLNQQGDKILREILGYKDGQISDLQSCGAII